MRILLSLALVCAAAAMAGCNTIAPIQNVSNASVIGPSGKSLSTEEVRSAIFRAGAGLGWIMTEARPGVVKGKLILRTHTAEVEIPYSQTEYSIVYKTSVNLEEASGKIHRAYNGWIQNLNRGINAQLAAT
jgi:hypothetical protein